MKNRNRYIKGQFYSKGSNESSLEEGMGWESLQYSTVTLSQSQKKVIDVR